MNNGVVVGEVGIGLAIEITKVVFLDSCPPTVCAFIPRDIANRLFFARDRGNSLCLREDAKVLSSAVETVSVNVANQFLRL